MMTEKVFRNTVPAKVCLSSCFNNGPSLPVFADMLGDHKATPCYICNARGWKVLTANVLAYGPHAILENFRRKALPCINECRRSRSEKMDLPEM